MTLIKFNERFYEYAKIINLKQNMINEIDWDVIAKFVNLQIINLKDQDSNLCFLKPEFNTTKTLILNDCDMDNITGEAVSTTQTILKTEPGILKRVSNLIHKIANLGVTSTTPNPVTTTRSNFVMKTDKRIPSTIKIGYTTKPDVGRLTKTVLQQTKTFLKTTENRFEINNNHNKAYNYVFVFY